MGIRKHNYTFIVFYVPKNIPTLTCLLITKIYNHLNLIFMRIDISPHMPSKYGGRGGAKLLKYF